MSSPQGPNLPPLTPGYAPQTYGPGGEPIEVIQSAAGPLSPATSQPMPQGMMPAVPTAGMPQGMVGSLGNTPTTTSPEALNQLAQDQATNFQLLVAQMQRMSASVESDFKKIKRHTEEMTLIQTEAIEHAIHSLRSEVQGTGATVASRQPGQAAPEAPKPDRPAQVPHAEPSDIESTPEEPRRAAQGGRHPHAAPDPAERFRHGHQVPQNRSEGGGRHEAAEPPHPADGGGQARNPHGLPRMSEMGYAEARNGVSIPFFTRRIASSMAQRIGAHTGQYAEDPETGALHEGGQHGPVIGATHAATIRQASRVGEALGKYARSGDVAELGGLVRFAGPVGLAVGGMHILNNVIGSQQAQNAVYQQMTGGSNLSGFASGLNPFNQNTPSRVGEEVFTLRNMSLFGGIGEGNARELYRGVSSLLPGAGGEDNGIRSAAMDFAVKQFHQYGTSIADSLNLISTSIRNGVNQFGSLNDAIDSVSQTAQQAGRNVGEAQKSFSQIYGQVTGNVTASGTTSAQVSSAIQNVITQQGEALNIDPGALTGALTGTNLLQNASQLGINPNTAIAQLGEGGPGATRLAGQLIGAQWNQLTQATIPAQAQDEARQIAQRNGYQQGDYATEGVQRDVGSQLIQNGSVNVQAFLQLASSRGMNLSQSQAVQMIGRLALSGGDIGITQQANKAAQAGTFNGAVTTGTFQGHRLQQRDTHQMVDPYTGKAVTNAQQRDPQYQATHPTAISSYTYQTRRLEDYLGTSSHQADIYASMAAHDQSRSALAEAVLRNENDYKKQDFLVQTSKGQQQVSYSELFQHYKDQLKHGDVRLASTGELLSDVTGVQGDPNQKVTSATEAPRGDSKSVDKGSRTQGSIKIEASADLQRFLNFYASGGLTIDSAKRSGVPAAPFPSAGDTYPSANGD